MEERKPTAAGEKVLLVLDYTTDWYKQFRGVTTAKGEKIRVEQTEWKDIHVEARYPSYVIFRLRFVVLFTTYTFIALRRDVLFTSKHQIIRGRFRR